MTLKEKFGEIWVGRGTFEDDCEKIAEDFAIGFAEWITQAELPLEELLEMYKEKKGL